MPDITNNTYRSVVPFVRDQLPAFIRDSQSALPDFLEAYYEWMELEGNPTDIIESANSTNDVNATLDKFYSEFKSEYLDKFPNVLQANKENLVKNIREFYRAKGTEKAVKLLFRILFDEEIDVQYPSDRILKPSSGSFIRKTFIRVVGDSDIFNADKREVYFLEQKITLENVTGTYQVGETVISKDSNGLEYERGEVHSIEADSIIITTDFDGQFRTNLILEGQTSNATGNIITSEDFSKRAFIENVSELDENGTTYYQAEVSGLFDTVKPNLIVRTIFNENAPLVEFRNSSMVVGHTVIDGGLDYSINNGITLASNGDGIGFNANVSDVKSLSQSVTGAFTEVNALPSDVLQYTPLLNETIQSFLQVGNVVRIDNLPYIVSDIDISLQQITLTENVPINSDLSTFVKSHKFDTRAITQIDIVNPGFGYTIAPVLDLSGEGNGQAIIELQLGGSFVEEFGYIDDKGHLSSTMRLQDDGQFQDFSYTIKSGNSINLWRNVLTDLAHPAGMLVSGEISSITSSIGENSLTITQADQTNLLIIGGIVAQDGLRVDSTEETNVTSTFETVILPTVAGSYYTSEFFDVASISRLPINTIQDLVDNYNGDSIVNFSRKYGRGQVLTEIVE